MNPTITDWVQAACAATTLLLAIVTLIQGRKIKTLTDIVESLNQQAVIWRQILDFEIKSRIAEAQPVFVPFRINDEVLAYNISIRNKGAKCRSLRIKAADNVKSISPSFHSVVLNMKLVEFRFVVTNKNEGYKIDLHYQGEFDESYRQVITGKGKYYVVSMPESVDAGL